MRVFVNAVALDLEKGADVRGAVAALDGALAGRLESGSAFVTDARGIEVPLDAGLVEGAILRVVVSARRAAGETDADA